MHTIHLKKSLSVNLQSQEVLLHGDKVLFVPRLNTLCVADVHLGKGGTFRQAGVPVPGGSTENDLHRLSNLIDELKPTHLIFLGDLFHSKKNEAWQQLKSWRELHPSVKMILVSGNHDILEENDYTLAGLEVVEEPMEIGSMVLSHHPPENHIEKEKLYLCGHIHPGVRVTTSPKYFETLPCFYFHQNVLLLPSFGSFTGLASIKPKKGSRVFVASEGQVLELE